MISPRTIARWFTYHPPTEDEPARYEAIRAAAKQLAETIVATTPANEDQEEALTLLRSTVMFANASIACRQVDAEPLPGWAPEVAPLPRRRDDGLFSRSRQLRSRADGD